MLDRWLTDRVATRLLSGGWRYDRITPVLQELHWLPVRRRVGFKMARTLVYLSLSGMASAYLAADCQLVSGEGRRQLRSANSRTCVVRPTYSSYADRCFAAARPTLWNSLPAHLRQTYINFEQFERLLKTFLFGCWDRGALWLTVKLRLFKLSYLLTYLLKHTYYQVVVTVGSLGVCYLRENNFTCGNVALGCIRLIQSLQSQDVTLKSRRVTDDRPHVTLNGRVGRHLCSSSTRCQCRRLLTSDSVLLLLLLVLPHPVFGPLHSEPMSCNSNAGFFKTICKLSVRLCVKVTFPATWVNKTH